MRFNSLPSTQINVIENNLRVITALFWSKSSRKQSRAFILTEKGRF
jgi:hypothetical protein